MTDFMEGASFNPTPIREQPQKKPILSRVKRPREGYNSGYLSGNPKTKDVRTSIKPDKIDELTAQLVALKPFFMNEITRLKKALLNGWGVFFLKKI